MNVSKNKRKVAVFDVDGTIFRSSLLIELVNELIKRNLFPKEAYFEYEKQYKKWTDRKDDYEKYIMAVVKVFMKYIKNISYGDFIEASEFVVLENQDRVYRYTRDLVKELKKKGYFLLAISQSPKGTLDQFCFRMGFDKVYGRLYELGAEDRFTGKVTDEHLILNKATILRRAVEKENLTLKDSYAVGDTEGDIPMLELADNPICFNPNQKLYRIAKINKWKVVVERKDVTYMIQ